MEYIVNHTEEIFKIIMFEYDGRNWEICFLPSTTEEEIQELITRRINDLIIDYSNNSEYDKSDLFVDYIDYETNKNI
jgi:hypothetical protein